MRFATWIVLGLMLLEGCKSRPKRPNVEPGIIDRIFPGSSNSDPTVEPSPSSPQSPNPNNPVAQGPVVQSPSSPPVTVDPNTPLAIAKRFAPVLWLAPQESYYPMDPEEFFKKPQNERSEEFFRSARNSYKQGRQARVVVNISDDKSLIQYWIFYPKNGCQSIRLAMAVVSGIKNPFAQEGLIKTEDKETAIEICNLAVHEGDWENVTMKLNKEFTQIENVYVSAHGRGNWLPPSALRMKEARPFLYSALNSHALFPALVEFAADATIGKDQLAKVPSLQWFQVGDAMGASIGMQSDTSGGQGAVEFDTAKALWMWSDMKDTDLAKYNGKWGQDVDGKKVLPPPKITNALTTAVFDKISEIVFSKVSALEGKSSGDAPASPWARDDWKNFDCANCGGRVGLGRMSLAGTAYGDAFDDFEKVKPRDRYKVKQIRVSGKSNITRICMVVDGSGDNCHGGSWDGEQTLNLDDDDFLTRLDVAFYESNGNRFVSAVKFSTRKGKVLQLGPWTSIVVEQSAPPGTQIVGIHGRADHDIRQLGIIVGTAP